MKDSEIRFSEDERQQVNLDKVWATVSATVNLGNYENIKIEMGSSRNVLLEEDIDDVRNSVCRVLLEDVLVLAGEAKSGRSGFSDAKNETKENQRFKRPSRRVKNSINDEDIPQRSQADCKPAPGLYWLGHAIADQ